MSDKSFTEKLRDLLSEAPEDVNLVVSARSEDQVLNAMIGTSVGIIGTLAVLINEQPTIIKLFSLAEEVKDQDFAKEFFKKLK